MNQFRYLCNLNSWNWTSKSIVESIARVHKLMMQSCSINYRDPCAWSLKEQKEDRELIQFGIEYWESMILIDEWKCYTIYLIDFFSRCHDIKFKKVNRWRKRRNEEEGNFLMWIEWRRGELYGLKNIRKQVYVIFSDWRCIIYIFLSKWGADELHHPRYIDKNQQQKEMGDMNWNPLKTERQKPNSEKSRK